MSKLTEHEITRIHQEVRREADAAKSDTKKLDEARNRALDRADRREYAQRKFKVGGERRWRETF